MPARVLEDEPDCAWSDREVDAFSNADELTRSVVCKRLRPLIEGTLLRVLGARDESHEDLVQTVYEQLASTIHSGKFARECNLATWAATLTRHLALNVIRGRRRERRIIERRVRAQRIIDGSAGSANVEAQVAVMEFVQRLRDYLPTMNPDRACAVLLHDGLGYDLMEICALTGASYAAAQSRLCRGRRELRASISGGTPTTRAVWR